MARTKKTIIRDLSDALKEEARAIYLHAGAFLMREVCDKLADLLEAASARLREVEAELTRVLWDNEQAEQEIGVLASQIEELERRLAQYEVPLLDHAPGSMTGGQGFSES